MVKAEDVSPAAVKLALLESTFPISIKCSYTFVWAAGLRLKVLKFGESRFLLALEVFDHISDGGEAVHSP